MKRIVLHVAGLFGLMWSVVATAQTVPPLHVHFAVERFVFDTHQSNCVTAQFEGYASLQDEFIAWASSAAENHSLALTGRNGLLQVDPSPYRFTLTDLLAELARMKAATANAALKAQIDNDVALLGRIRDQDRRLFSALAESCKKAETVTTNRGEYLYWTREALRRTAKRDFGLLVERVARFRLAKYGEQHAIVFLTPYQYTDFEPESALALMNLFAGTTPPAGFSGVGHTQGFFAPLANQVTRPGMTPELQLRRGVVSVGGYALRQTKAVQHTYLHELGHYLGLRHVFSSTHYFSSRLGFRDAYGQFDNGSQEQKQRICELPLANAPPAQYWDEDGKTSGVHDTGLVLRHQSKNWFLFVHSTCRAVSPVYRAAFPETDASATNLMRYFKTTQNPETFLDVTLDQQALARRMLQSFTQ